MNWVSASVWGSNVDRVCFEIWGSDKGKVTFHFGKGLFWDVKSLCL